MLNAFLFDDPNSLDVSVNEQGIWIGTTVYPAVARVLDHYQLAGALQGLIAQQARPGSEWVFFSPTAFEQQVVNAFAGGFYDFQARYVTLATGVCATTESESEADFRELEFRANQIKVKCVCLTSSAAVSLEYRDDAEDGITGALVTYFEQIPQVSGAILLFIGSIAHLTRERMDFCMRISNLFNGTNQAFIEATAYYFLLTQLQAGVSDAGKLEIPIQNGTFVQDSVEQAATQALYPVFSIDNEEQLYQLHSQLQSKNFVYALNEKAIRLEIRSVKQDALYVRTEMAQLVYKKKQKQVFLDSCTVSEPTGFDFEYYVEKYANNRRLEFERGYLAKLQKMMLELRQ